MSKEDKRGYKPDLISFEKYRYKYTPYGMELFEKALRETADFKNVKYYGTGEDRRDKESS